MDALGWVGFEELVAAIGECRTSRGKPRYARQNRGLARCFTIPWSGPHGHHARPREPVRLTGPPPHLPRILYPRPRRRIQRTTCGIWQVPAWAAAEPRQ